MDIISSKENKAVKAARKLLQKKYRKSSYLLEGFHLYEEAEKAGAKFLQVFVTEEFADKYEHATVVSQEILNYITDSQTPQGLAAIVEKEEVATSKYDNLQGKILFLDKIQDPGNVGTIIRTADAANFDAVVVSKDSADIFSPKVMRSMQGSNFHLPIFIEETEKFYEDLGKKDLSIIASTLSDESVSYKEVAEKNNFVLVLGNEGSGISELTKDKADKFVHIDMPGQAESLNVAVAAGILIFNFI